MSPRFRRALALLLLASPPVGAARLEGERLSFDLLFAEHAGGRQPTKIVWAPDGGRLAYLWPVSAGGPDGLWELDPAGGEPRLLLDPSRFDDLSLDAFHWSPDGGALLIESAGDLVLLPAGGDPPRRLTETEAKEEDPKFSPDGTRIAFVRDADLHLLELPSGRERALTVDGEPDEILNGVTDWVYWEELWGRDSTGYWWSPDGRRIAFYRFDESPVRSYPLVDFTTVYPQVEWQRYPKAGEANPNVRVGVLELTGGVTWLETGAAEEFYLPRVDWLPGGERVAVQRLTREQDRLDLLSCEPMRGSCSTLLTESWPTWINLHRDLTFLAGGGFVWSSEASGWRRLYLHDAAGRRVRDLSPAGWAVTSLDGVVESDGYLIFTAYSADRLGAVHRRVFRQPLAGGPARPLSAAEGWSSANVAPATGNWVHRWSRLADPGWTRVRGGDGAELARLPSEPPRFDVDGLPSWELLTIPGPDGMELPAALLRPAEHAPGERHPVIMYQYGGPGSQVVADRWSSRERALWHLMMAQHGYGVLSVDNAGSTFFGKAGEDRMHRRFGEWNLAAQRAGVAWLGGLDWVDTGRIGLWGWSGGGSNTLYSVLASPGTWAAAVAGAPVTNWYLYDTIWTERYLDHPADNPDGYRDSSVTTHAARLADPLLIVHGTADDNVHPQNTLQMIHALVEAGRPFELAIYPRQKHGLRGDASRHFYERMTEFFDRHLRRGRTATP